MRTATVRSRSASALHRLDANYFTSSGVAASERVALMEAQGLPVVTVRELARVWDPPRFARAFAAPREPGLPYLRPYDVFEFRPEGTSRLSISRNDDLERLRPAVGTILQTCSGRNLGPLTITDEVLSRHALSHDMIRIETSDVLDRFYLFAFLRTPEGQSLLRRGRSGSVIDHITVADVQAVPVPLVKRETRVRIAEALESAYMDIAVARTRMVELMRSVQEEGPVLVDRRAGWTVKARDLAAQGRIDAGYFAPAVMAARAQARSGGGNRLTDLAEVSILPRYKRFYVDEPWGRPILSGRQLLQLEPVNLQRVSDRSFRDPENYVVRTNMTVMAADGRAEGGQGVPALIQEDRNGWLASNAIMRLVPRSGVRPGRLWLSLATEQARVQVKAASYGSVVDHLTAADMRDVFVPDVSDSDVDEAEACWALFADAGQRAKAATAELQSALAALSV